MTHLQRLEGETVLVDPTASEEYDPAVSTLTL